MKNEQGFSLIEVIIAILIITTGLLALSAALVIGITLPGRARQQEIAKQLAAQIMESIIAAKEATRPGFSSFDSLNYTTGTPAGRFVPGVAAMLESGPDNVFGTCDDGQPPGPFNPVCTGMGTRIIQLDIDPGPDGIYSNRSDNRTNSLLTFTREIIITDLTPAPVTSKQITVRVNFTTPTGSRDSVTLVCQLSNFRTL
ncbi:MAG: prepilin-type N-terminal cleavage/methylation domain-containing protein [Acidobacteriota bacterium]